MDQQIRSGNGPGSGSTGQPMSFSAFVAARQLTTISALRSTGATAAVENAEINQCTGEVMLYPGDLTLCKVGDTYSFEDCFGAFKGELELVEKILYQWAVTEEAIPPKAESDPGPGESPEAMPIYKGHWVVLPLTRTALPKRSDEELEAYWRRWLDVIEQARGVLSVEPLGTVLVCRPLGLGLALGPTSIQRGLTVDVFALDNAVRPSALEAAADDRSYFDAGEMAYNRTVEHLEQAARDRFPERLAASFSSLLQV